MYEYFRSSTTSQPVHTSSIAVSKRSGLRFEMERWLEVRSRLNGVPWYDATRHVLTISGATDASSQACGGLIRGPFGAFSVFKATTDFPAAWHNAHINVKETFALHEVLKLVTTIHPGCLKGSTAVVDVDNKPMHDAFKNRRSRNTQTHDLITKLFWMQEKEDFTLELRWVCSEANWAPDSLTRPERTAHVRLSHATFDRLWETWGGIDMDLMATDTSAQYAPIEGGWERQKLPFYSRFHTNNTAGVDVFSHNVSHRPGWLLFRTTVLGGSSVGAHK